MRSIDNLREWWRDRFPVMDRQLGCDFREHIDAIELEVKELRDRDYRNGREDAKGAVEFADRLKAAVDNREDVTLFGVDYTPLPVDADGEPIHVGDVMEWRYDNGEFEVIGIGGNTLFYIDKDSGECEWTAAWDKHHHHAPTVEDVLDESFGKANLPDGTQTRAEIIAEYAAKLRLAEGSE